jgi:5-methylthioadenosine/S-adenosylhomocysteine deaminase
VLIRGTFVLSLDPEVGDRADCDVLIDDGVIVEIGPGLPVAGAEVVDGSRTIAIPGFVDTHRHTWQTALRGVLPACSLDEYVVARCRFGPLFAPDDVYVANLLGSLEALDAGITTMLDWSHISNTPEHADEAVRGLADSGIRAVYAHGVPAGTEWGGQSTLAHPDDARRIRERYFASDDQLLTFAMALRVPGIAAPEVVLEDWRLARELDARITAHVGMRMVGRRGAHVSGLAELGLLGPDVTYVHCNDSSDDELDLIAETGGTVSIAPFVEMVMGHGYPPTGRFLERGVRPSLSVDVTTSGPGDMFSQMRTAFAAERIRAFTDDEHVPFAPTLTPRDVLEFATIEGARACGLESKIGSLAPGKDADIVLLRTDLLNVAPVWDPVAAVVLHADLSNVDTVLVRGRFRKREGRLVQTDLPSLVARAEGSRERILGAAGPLTNAVAAHHEHDPVPIAD